MATSALSRLTEKIPSVFDDFFKPWDDWLDGGLSGRVMNIHTRYKYYGPKR